MSASSLLANSENKFRFLIKLLVSHLKINNIKLTAIILIGLEQMSSQTIENDVLYLCYTVKTYRNFFSQIGFFFIRSTFFEAVTK